MERDFSILNYTITTDTINCFTTLADLNVTSEDLNAEVDWVLPNLDEFNGYDLQTDQTGIFEIQITQSNGCQIDTSLEVILDNIVPGIELDTAEIICGIDSVQLIPVYESNNVEISWTGPFGFTSIQPQPWVDEPGWYYVTQIEPSNGCGRLDSVLVEAGENIPILNVNVDVLNCDVSEVTFQVNLTTDHVYQWSGPDGFNSNLQEPTVDTPGAYQVTVTDLNSGCTAKDVLQVGIDTIAPALMLSGQNLDCQNLSSILGATSDANLIDFRWYTLDGFSSDELNPEISQEGWYVFEAMAENNCVNIDSIEILSDIDLPVMETLDTFLGCATTTIQLEVNILSPFDEIIWDGPNGFNAMGQFPDIDQSGVYYVEVVSPNGCSSFDSLMVTEDFSVPSFTFDLSNQITCENEFATIGFNSTDNIVDISWVGPNGFSASTNPIVVSNEGMYYLNVTAYNTCSYLDSIEILRLDDFPEIELTTALIQCDDFETDVNVIHNETNPMISWSGPNGFVNLNASFNTDMAGLYHVALTDENGCTTLDSILVEIDTISPSILINPTELLTCNNTDTPIGLTPSVSDSIYEWSGPGIVTENSDNFVVTEAGLYSVMVTSTNHCTSLETVEVLIDTSKADIQLEGGIINCLESKVDLNATIDITDYTIEWSGPDNFTSDIIDPLTFSGGWHYVAVTGDNGCISIDSVYVVEDFETPDLMANTVFFPCNGDSVILSVEIDTFGVNYQWFGPNNFYSELENPAGYELGEYVLVSSFDNGCLRYDTFEVTNVPILPPFDAIGGHLDCEQTSVILSTDLIEYNEILWTGPNNFSSNEDNPEVTEAGSYTMVVETVGECFSVRQTEVTIDTMSPEAIVDQNAFFLCDIREIELNGTQSTQGVDISYEWNSDNGNIVSGNTLLNPTVDMLGDYTLIVTNEINQCVDSQSVEVYEEVSDLTDILTINTPPACLGYSDGSIVIESITGGISPYEYAFNQGAYEDVLSFENISAGQYLVEVKDSAGCVFEKLLQINDGFDFTLDLGQDTTIVLGESLDIIPLINTDISNVSVIEWIAINDSLDCVECFDNLLSPSENSVYQLFLETNEGCFVADAITVFVTNDVPIYIPNAFSPNGDRHNELFFISSNGAVKEVLELNIFDRWGNSVFSQKNFPSDDESFSWDGKLNGQHVVDGVYVYFVELELIDGTKRKISGDITILR